MSASSKPPATPTATTRGRPRDKSRDLAIDDATLALLVEVGYDQMSIESIAARAGVGKTTIYRRYLNKASLVAAAVDRRRAWTVPEVSSGDLRTVLMDTVSWMATEIGHQQVGLLGAVFAGMRSDPSLAEAMRAILARDQTSLVDGFLDQSLAAFDVTSGSAALLAEVATALVVHRVLLGGPCDDTFLDHLVDDILIRVLT